MVSKSFSKSWGAKYVAYGAVRFRLWATGQDSVALRLAGKDTPMNPSGDGWFDLLTTGVAPGTEYHFVLAGGIAVPDPASRAQKAEADGPSLVIDPTRYDWQNTHWHGRPWEETVVYEMHIGTFTPEGTFKAAIEKLPYLAATGQRAENVIAFARAEGDDALIVIAPRLVFEALHGSFVWPHTERRAQMEIPLPQRLANRHYRDILSGEDCFLTDRINLASIDCCSPVILIPGR